MNYVHPNQRPHMQSTRPLSLYLLLRSHNNSRTEQELKRLSSQPPRRCRTVALETGMQNTQLCSTIVQLSFTPEELNLVFTFPLIYSVFQLLFAAILLGSKQQHQLDFFVTFLLEKPSLTWSFLKFPVPGNELYK